MILYEREVQKMIAGGTSLSPNSKREEDMENLVNNLLGFANFGYKRTEYLRSVLDRPVEVHNLETISKRITPKQALTLSCMVQRSNDGKDDLTDATSKLFGIGKDYSNLVQILGSLNKSAASSYQACVWACEMIGTLDKQVDEIEQQINSAKPDR